MAIRYLAARDQLVRRSAGVTACALLIIAALLLLAGCADRPWKGLREERIDAAVASVDFASVGGIHCDYRMPGNNLTGRSATRLFGIAGADNAAPVVELLNARGFTAKRPEDDISDGYLSLSDSSGQVEFWLSVVPDGGRGYADGHCTSPPEGVISIQVIG